MVLDILGVLLSFIPPLKWLGQRLLERDMDLELREPHSKLLRGRDGLNIPPNTGPIFTVHVGQNPHIYMWCDLVLTNNRVSRREVISECQLCLNRRRWLFWEEEFAVAPVLVEKEAAANREGIAWRPVILEPQSPPSIISVQAQGPINYPIVKLPRKMRLTLKFRMVGPIRYMKISLREYHHKLDKASPPTQKSEKGKS